MTTKTGAAIRHEILELANASNFGYEEAEERVLDTCTEEEMIAYNIHCVRAVGLI